MKKYLFLLLACAGALTFTSCGNDDEVTPKPEEKPEYLETKTDIEANLKGSKWVYEYNDKEFTSEVTTNAGTVTRNYKETKRVAYTFNADGKTGNYSNYSKRVYDNDPSNPIIDETDYDFSYEIDSKYDDFFQSYNNGLDGVITKMNKGADSYYKEGKTFYEKIQYMTRTSVMFDMTTYEKK